MNRVRIEAVTRPTVAAGRTTWVAQPVGLSNRDSYPDGGSQARTPENSRMPMIPIQKSGTDTPIWLNTRAAWSTAEPLRTPEMTPSGNATRIASTIAVSASDSVAGSRSRTIVDTG